MVDGDGAVRIALGHALKGDHHVLVGRLYNAVVQLVVWMMKIGLGLYPTVVNRYPRPNVPAWPVIAFKAYRSEYYGK
ncbi:hypothetical protein GCM10010411_00620 [Actinomadura fulvescens]|uniref:Uncharacterized protein n=1 Tax=Actinomadura fulvescens TaxID=46160 RepID=A0ABN3PA19_9ACTN